MFRNVRLYSFSNPWPETEEALSEAGRTLLKDVLEARTELQRARAEAAKARTDIRLAQAFLLKLQGQLSQNP